MIGIIPSSNKTFEVYGDFNSKNLVEGKLYYDDDGRLFYYSTTSKRSNPSTGYFPIWDGHDTYFTKFSVNHNISEVTSMSVSSIANNMNNEKAMDILYRQNKSKDEDVLKPEIKGTDNMFTQVIKAVLLKYKCTIQEIVAMSAPKMSQTAIENLYSSLIKISFMRIERWNVWVDIILHLHYELTVYKENKLLLSYKYPENKFDTGIVNYDSIVGSKSDPFTKIVKILLIMENINKSSIRDLSTDVDSYTVNNMFTTIMSDKPLSAQLFSRFIRITGLSYNIKVYNKENDLLVDYKEGM